NRVEQRVRPRRVQPDPAALRAERDERPVVAERRRVDGTAPAGEDGTDATGEEAVTERVLDRVRVAEARRGDRGSQASRGIDEQVGLGRLDELSSPRDRRLRA